MTCNSQSEPEPMESDSPDDFRRGSLDFDHWTSLISETENAFPDDIERICSVYDSFLAEFPLCHGYWRRYADHKVRLCSVAEVVEVFERAVQSATYSVPLWVDYCNFSVSAFEDASDICRLFERGMSCVGKDYSCHALWDKYIEFEYSRQQWSSLAQIFIQALSFPTKKLHRYYESLKNLAALCEEEMKCQSNSTVDLKSETVLDSEVPTFYRDDEIAVVVRDLLDPEIILERSKALQKYICIGKQLYQEACQLDGKLGTFEINIRRSYFHVKPLDACQLENWHRYLDFVEMQGDFDWTVKLYERCLIPCANYPEFWMRYVDFMEINGGREIANYALDRATQVLLKRVSVIHLFNARFKEQIGDVSGAHSAFLQCNAESDSHFVKNVMLKANMEKRRGCFTAASTIYKEALEMAEKKKKLHTLPILYVRFSQLTHMMTDSADAARDVLIDGIKHLPNCKSLLEELISFAMMHGGKRHLNMIESAVANAISPVSGVSSGLDAKDAEDISSLYLEFVDLCGTIHEVRKAWNRHVRLFPYSTRTAYFAQQATFTTPLKMARGTEETLVAIPKQPSGDYNSDSLIELPLHDRNMLLRDNPNIESDQDRTDQISDLKLPSPGSQLEQTDSDKLQSRQPEDLQESMKLPYTEVSREQQSRDDTPEASFSSIDLVKVKQVSPESSEEPKGNSGPNSSSVELGCQVAEGNEFVESAQEDRSRNDGQQHRDNKSEQELKPLSLERLSLNSQENRNIDLIHSISLKCEASQETSTSNERKLESNCKSNEDSYMYIPGNARASERNEVVSRTPTQALSQPAVNSYGDWRQNNRSGKVRRDSRFGSRGRLQRRSYQQKPASPQKYLQTETGGQMPGSLGLPSQFVSSQGPQIHQRSQDHNPYQAAFTPANIMAPNAWPVQTVQQPNFASSGQPQLPVQSVAPQVSQDSQPSILGNGQNWMQNNQAYNQMWQYYYYQQQQQFLLQQQMQQAQQQQQPQQQQQLLLQQYQQQQLQLQQYYAQMQQQQPYQQQQQLPLQQQQYSPQLQMQQQQLQQPPLQQLHEQQLPLQQQPQLHEQQLPLQQQQYSHQLQLQPQLHEQQQQLHEQQQQYSHQLQMQEQQLQQQPQLHEQPNMFYVQQHQQPVQQPSSVQEQQQQQISSSGIQHDNYYHEDPAAIPPENPDGYGTVVSSVSPHTPKESPQK